VVVGIPFTKMSGSGNDFVIIDNREPVLDPETKRDFVKKVCQLKNSVGADGVIFVENSDKAAYKWDFYNPDGSSPEMCGNGGRCVARYAFEKGIAPQTHSFETIAGIIEAEVNGPVVKVKLTRPENLQNDMQVAFDGLQYKVDSINTGVPHAIIFSEDVDGEDINVIGNGIRYHSVFAPAGTNVDLVEKKNGNALKVRTYERGVEGETLACGTGVVASAIIASHKFKIESPVNVETRGGEILKVHIEPANGSLPVVYLEGLTKITFEGQLVEL
jgi:diaminopimelate epimerase